MLASYAEKNVSVVVSMFVCAMSFLGNFYPGLKVNSLDLSPNYAGALMVNFIYTFDTGMLFTSIIQHFSCLQALTNGIGGISGVVVPPFIGWIVDDVST